MGYHLIVSDAAISLDLQGAFLCMYSQGVLLNFENEEYVSFISCLGKA